MEQGEYLFPLPSVNAFVGDKLNVYKMNEQGLPDTNLYSDLGAMASQWVNKISKDDDSMLSELIYEWEREY